MKIRILIPAFLTLAAACSGDDPPARQPAAEPAKAEAPAPQAPVDPLEAARRRVAEVDTMRVKRPDRERLWAMLPEQAEIVVVKDTASWPDEVESSMSTFTDLHGRPIAFTESPFSISGDWFAVGTHWFDEQGRTVAFELHVSAFSSGCTEIVRDTWRTLYDASFRALRTDTTHTDGDGKLLAADCQPPGDFSDMVAPAATYDALVRAGRAPSQP
jgi:hypothetical protein